MLINKMRKLLTILLIAVSSTASAQWFGVTGTAQKNLISGKYRWNFGVNGIFDPILASYVDSIANLKVNKTVTVAGKPLSSNVTLTKADVLLPNVDNTSDLLKPVSTATLTALNLKANTNSPSLTGIPLAPTATAGTNNTQLATTAYVTTAVSAATIPDATTLVKGKIKLAGDLSGTADLPTVPALLDKVDKTTTVNGHLLSSNVVVTKGDVGLGNVDNTSDVNKPISSAQQSALDLKADGFYQLPNGKNVVDFLIDGKNARVITSNNYSVTGVPQKLAIFFHFYGGNYTTTPSSKLRDSLLNNGYSIASISAGETWGNEKGQQLYLKLYNHVIKKLNVDKQPIAVSASMGTLTAFNTINRNTIPFRAFISTIGVVNLGEYYGRAVGFGAGNDIQTAYQFSTPADSTKAFFGFDPYTRLKTVFGDTTYKVSCPVYFINGAIDASTPIRYTSRIYTGLTRSYSNSVLEIVPGVGHDTAIVTSAIANRVMLWLKSNPLTTRALPDTALVLKANNGIIMRDKVLGSAQRNFIDFRKNDGIRRGLFGFLDPSTMGNDGMAWINNYGSIGIFSETISNEISLGVVNSSNILTKNFTLNSTGLNIKLPTTIDATLRVRGGLRVERISTDLQYTNIDHEAGATTILAKNGSSAAYSQVIISQGNNVSDRVVLSADGNGKIAIPLGASLSIAPTAATDIVRKTELDLKANTASPGLTGVPTAPTATAGTNTNQLATTAFVQGAVSAAIITSGTYTPTVTLISNTTSATVQPATYSRIGNVVTVYGRVSVTATATGDGSFRVSIPIASTFTTTSDGSGIGSCTDIQLERGYLTSNSVTNDMTVGFQAYTAGLARTLNYSYQYIIK